MDLDDMKAKRPVDQDKVDRLKKEMQDTALVSPTGYTNDTVTITIRREDARYMAKQPQMYPAEARISLACRVALNGGK